MQASKHNIIGHLKDSSSWFIVNPLSGNADILEADIAQQIISGNYNNTAELIEKGYYVDSIAEEKLFKHKYLEFIDTRDTDEVQLFFVSTYACNFKCSYCYQDGYNNTPEMPYNSIIDAFIKYISTAFKGRKKYVTLFGGEPLLPGTKVRESISYLISQLNAISCDLAVVTNGYHLSEYVDLLKTASIREIQVTLDGVGIAHDKRRMLASGASTFEKVVEGIDRALELNIPINLRMVLDRENIAQLPELARFAIARGWTNNRLFKTQLGRNYELHFCQSENTKLYDRVSMYQDIYQLIKFHPEILSFHRPAFSLAKFLTEEGELPSPLFDSCPGFKTEWAFDYSGNVYSCTATVGKPGESLGTYYPQVALNNEAIEEWQERDVLSIAACKTCNLQLACGGGCASVAKNKCGSLHSPDCRPVKELLEMGLSLYSE